MIYEHLLAKKSSLAVIGLGYVGLPVALEFAKHIKVVGFDINSDRIDLLNNKTDPSNEIESEAFNGCDITFSASQTDLDTATFFVVAVPTPIDEYNQPDLTALLSASTTVAKSLKKGDYVVFESTVFPGCTEEKCVPILEQISGLKFKDEFKVGYSPERINPGDKEHTLVNVTKVVSGCDAESLDIVAKVYELVVKVGVHRASSIKVAEATKVIENTQRDLNIALMNELSMIFDRVGINTYEVIEAAATKWNFLKFTPGLVGGHCIGVDPYYLTYKSTNLGHNPKVILSGREINDSMGIYVARKTIKMLTTNKVDIPKAKVLVMGITFKENVSDIRNSKVVDVIKELNSFNIEVDVIDAFANAAEFNHEYGLNLIEKPQGKYQAVILAVSHNTYLNKDEKYFLDLLTPDGIFIDIKGIYRTKIKSIPYWCL
ncbi:MAG: nucleotide sugar dehydrogenase [Cytophagales bacterium]